MATRLLSAFPKSLANDVAKVVSVLPAADIPPSTKNIGPITIKGESIQIPYRIYHPELEQKATISLTYSQRIILACLYTRHHDGFIREKHVTQLMGSHDYWVPPFLLQLFGEYVVEIVLAIARQVNQLEQSLIAQFAQDNQQFICLTRSRVVSYWNCYYRWKYPRFLNYPGFIAMNELGLWSGKEARRLLKKPK